MDEISKLGGTIFNQVKASLGDLWLKLSVEDVDLISEVALDAANLQVQAMTFAGNAELTQKLLGEKSQIDAQFANIAAGNAEAVKSAFWDAVKNIAGAAVSVALAVV